MALNLVCKVGINDADYVVQPVINGRQEVCHFYQVWVSMIKRCYSKKFQVKNPAYVGCSVCEEWKTFSKFKCWMQNQNWRGKELDKDILLNGNKIYSPESCVFVSKIVNTFTVDGGASAKSRIVGACFSKNHKKFISRCNNPLSGEREHLGYFFQEIEAHQAWKKRKHELACQLAELQSDERVANALRTRYL